MPDDPNPDLVQITKADLATLQKSFTLLNKLWDDPEHGGDLKRAAKKVDPSLRIPEIDVAEPLLAPIRAEMEAFKTQMSEKDAAIAAMKQERDDEKALDKLRGTLSDAQKKYRLTDDGMAEVKKIMVERNIADPMAAAAFVVSEIEPAKPVTGTNFGPSDLNVFGIDGKSAEEDVKALHENPMKWMDKAVPEILAEFDREAA